MMDIGLLCNDLVLQDCLFDKLYQKLKEKKSDNPQNKTNSTSQKDNPVRAHSRF